MHVSVSAIGSREFLQCGDLRIPVDQIVRIADSSGVESRVEIEWSDRSEWWDGHEAQAIRDFLAARQG